MALLDQWGVAYEDTFQRKVMVAAVKTAKTVQTEDETTLSVPAGLILNQQQLHDRRSELAYLVMRSPEQWAKTFSIAVSANAAVTNASTDAAIEAEVAASWNAMALNGAD